MEKYLEDEPYLTINRIPLDDTLDIKGKLTESKSPTEGIVTFDIIFDAIVPKTDEEIKIIVMNLGKRSTSHKLLNMLYLLFMDKKKTEEKAEVITFIKNIRSLMKTMKLKAKQAMDALQVPEDKQKEYLPLI